MHDREHEDAMSLIVYSDDTGDAETIWNFSEYPAPKKAIGRFGRPLNRARCAPIYAPLYVPPVGSLVMMKASFDDILPIQQAYVEKVWDAAGDDALSAHPLFGHLGKDGAARFLAWAHLDTGRPHLARVSEEAHASFLARRERIIVGVPEVHLPENLESLIADMKEAASLT